MKINQIVFLYKIIIMVHMKTYYIHLIKRERITMRKKYIHFMKRNIQVYSEN